MNERSELIACIRGELVGPSESISDATVIDFVNNEYVDPIPHRRGPLVWRPDPDGELQEVLYYDRESPHRKYGIGLLHPGSSTVSTPSEEIAARATDTVGADTEPDDNVTDTDDRDESIVDEESKKSEPAEDFEVISPDVRHPSTIGISFCVRLADGGRVIVALPREKRFAWQPKDGAPIQVNGLYESCVRRWTDEHGASRDGPMWRRRAAVAPNTVVIFERSELTPGMKIKKDVIVPDGSPASLSVEVFPRRLRGKHNEWLLTLVLRNTTALAGTRTPREAVLYQTYFEVYADKGNLVQYPESGRPFEQLDLEEQSLALLYRESATWGIGHGCAAGWDAEPGQSPTIIYADVMPAVQLPSMTPDIRDGNGNTIRLSMRSLFSDLTDEGTGAAWQSLDNLAAEYSIWIQGEREKANVLDKKYAIVSARHLDNCTSCLDRINAGISLLRSDKHVREAFRLTNLAMLLQQISTKQLERRPLTLNMSPPRIYPEGAYLSPWDIYAGHKEDSARVGSWRAFQIAFLLMSLVGVRDGDSVERDIVDLIWFPTGGGKTEAYLAVTAFYIFHERLLMASGEAGVRRDGTNVLMRYTLRMLTTQQFQRAASLICAMEYLRRNPTQHNMGELSGERFSLGLWIGGAGSPIKIKDARVKVKEFQKGDVKGNPLVLTECPWCRSEIGRYDGPRPKAIPRNWNELRTKGITDDQNNGPLLHCTDSRCVFGKEHSQTWLPIEVVDERIYERPPSLVIATADKFAMISYRPRAGSIFGLRVIDGKPHQEFLPPGLIIQDELHLISGPLGTMYALYEGVIERLCSVKHNGVWVRPKLIASTATIRGACEQVLALYARKETKLFPSPGLIMEDSFFGKYARDTDGTLKEGRLYLGIHASDYGSVLTAQVRTFSSALFRPFSFAQDRRDPWWTLLAFYNSIRELSGAKTLFDSDIRSRLKFMFNRANYSDENRRRLMPSEELTSRFSQAEIVDMMDRLAVPYMESNNKALHACLASNIIEVGIDIERLSLMGIVGQPKTTASYIQVTGRVGRKWWERAGLILMIYNPSKSRDRSHYEQFHSYHMRLYERVEPTSATPFALSAIQRALPGALIAWARQHSDAPVWDKAAYMSAIRSGYQLLCDRCRIVQNADDQERSLMEMQRVFDELERKWSLNPQIWEEFPPKADGEYFMLWPGQFKTVLQEGRGFVVPSSMRQVDGNAELNITQGYAHRT